MATSGSKNFNLTVGQLLKAARRLVPGKPRVGGQNEDDHNREALNMLLKHWQAEGIGLWMIRGVNIFLSDGGYEYDLGPAGKFAYSMTKTELSADAASGAVSFTVDSATGISDGDYLGIELDDGTLQWTTVSGSPAGTTVTPAAALTGAASTDNHVYAFTTLADRPLNIWNLRLVDADGDETPIREISTQEYADIPDKDEEGTPNQWCYDKQLTNGKLKIWPAAEDVQYYLKGDVRVEIDDVDTVTEDMELPKQLYRALKFNLAADIFNEYDPEQRNAEIVALAYQDINQKARQFKEEIAGFDGEEGSIIFEYGD